MVELRHSPGITGGYTYAGEHYPVEDGLLEVAEIEVARDMVESERKISWVEEPDSPGANPGADGEETTFRCGVNDCSREVDDPDATCWQHE